MLPIQKDAEDGYDITQAIKSLFATKDNPTVFLDNTCENKECGKKKGDFKHWKSHVQLSRAVVFSLGLGIPGDSKSKESTKDLKCPKLNNEQLICDQLYYLVGIVCHIGMI